jgi:Phosphotransferase enzyme family
MWHATGAPRRRLLLGQLAGACETDEEGPIDIAIIAPAPQEASRTWLERAIADATDQLAGDGLVWVITARRWRGFAQGVLRKRALVLVDAVFTIPPWPSTTHLVPMAPAAVRDAAPRHLGLSPPAAVIIAGLLRSGMCRRALRRAAPGCALLAAAPGGTPVLNWLGEFDGQEVCTATVSAGLRRDARVAIAMRFGSASPPDLIVKAALDEAGMERVVHERAALEQLGPAAAAAGAAVPVARPSSRRWLLATDPIAGRSAAEILAHTPRRLERIATRVGRWLLAWNVATSFDIAAPGALLAEVVAGPVDRLISAGIAPADYGHAITSLAGQLADRTLVGVAVHNDLTMANILDDGRVLGILDWESGAAVGLPLTDLWYVLVDGIARAGGVAHWHAVQSFVSSGSQVPGALARLPVRNGEALGLTSDQAVLAFHACWLGHADNELHRGVTDGPFAAVVRAVAAQRLIWGEG